MPKINPRIKSIDDLLGLDAAEERPIEPTTSVSLPTKNTIITLPPQAIRAFRGHPFRLYEGDRLNDLVESISEHGVLNPAIIRKIERDEDGFEYEMLAGHNRQNAAAIANRELPCIVRKIFPMKMPGFMLSKPMSCNAPSPKCCPLKKRRCWLCAIPR